MATNKFSCRALFLQHLFLRYRPAGPCPSFRASLSSQLLLRPSSSLLSVSSVRYVANFLFAFDHAQKPHAHPRHDVRYLRRRHRHRTGKNLGRASASQDQPPQPCKTKFPESNPQRNPPRSRTKFPHPRRIQPTPRTPWQDLRRSRPKRMRKTQNLSTQNRPHRQPRPNNFSSRRANEFSRRQNRFHTTNRRRLRNCRADRHHHRKRLPPR